MQVIDVHDRPCAASGLYSFRYRGPYGWVMIGARDVPDAMKQAARSTSAPIDRGNLQEYRDGAYRPVD